MKIARILAFLAVIAITVFIYSVRDQAAQLAVYGYPGIFLISFLAYATVLLPAPGVAVVFAMGAVFNPFGVALAAGIGAALGESVGYLAGFSGQGVAERAEIYDRLTGWMQKNGPLTVLLLAAVPNPFFDLAGLIAGALKMPYLRFLFWCWLGQTIKMLFFAYLGNTSLDQIFGDKLLPELAAFLYIDRQSQSRKEFRNTIIPQTCFSDRQQGEPHGRINPNR